MEAGRQAGRLANIFKLGITLKSLSAGVKKYTPALIDKRRRLKLSASAYFHKKGGGVTLRVCMINTGVGYSPTTAVIYSWFKFQL